MKDPYQFGDGGAAVRPDTTARDRRIVVQLIGRSDSSIAMARTARSHLNLQTGAVSGVLQ